MARTEYESDRVDDYVDDYRPRNTKMLVNTWLFNETVDHPGPRINIQLHTHFPKSNRTKRDGILLSLKDAERLRDDLDARIKDAKARWATRAAVAAAAMDAKAEFQKGNL